MNPKHKTPLSPKKIFPLKFRIKKNINEINIANEKIGKIPSIIKIINTIDT